MRLGLALRAFWVALFHREAAERMALALDEPTEPTATKSIDAPHPLTTESRTEPQPAVPRPAKPETSQNPAITLLAALQRDARLIDLIFENLDQYQDAQVGAAARPCLKQCRQSLDRILKIEKLVDANENDVLTVPASVSAARYRWIGEGSTRGEAPAKLVHPGWQATAIELPQFSGADEDARIIAPAQVTAT